MLRSIWLLCCYILVNSAPLVIENSLIRAPRSIRKHTNELRINGPFPEGTWRKQSFCDNDEFIIGFRLVYQNYQSRQGVGYVFGAVFSFGISAWVKSLNHDYDDHGVLGVIFYCARRNWTSTRSALSIYNSYNDDTHFSSGHLIPGIVNSDPVFCNPGTVANEFSVHLQPRQGGNDDHGITNFFLICEDETTLHVDLGSEGFDTKETWTEASANKCKPGTALCGYQSKSEVSHHDDNTGLNDMILYCCKLPVPLDDSETCGFSDSWRTVLQYSNCNGTAAEIGFQFKAGISRGITIRNTHKKGSSQSSTSGFGVETETDGQIPFLAKAKLKARFEQQFEISESKGTETEKSKVEVFTDEHIFTQKLSVGSQRSLMVKQKIFRCGSYEIKTITIQSTQDQIPENSTDCQAFTVAAVRIVRPCVLLFFMLLTASSII